MMLDVIQDLVPGDLIFDGLTLTPEELPLLVTAVRSLDDVDGNNWIDFDSLSALGERMTPCELRRGTKAHVLRRNS